MVIITVRAFDPNILLLYSSNRLMDIHRVLPEHLKGLLDNSNIIIYHASMYNYIVRTTGSNCKSGCMTAVVVILHVRKNP